MSAQSRAQINEQRIKDTVVSEPLLERFIRYVKVWTTSDDSVPEKKPTTDRQWDLARILEKELKDLGIEDVSTDEHAFVIARIPATPGFEAAPCVGFMSHMDTALEVTGENVNPQIHRNYDGTPIEVGNGIVLNHPTLKSLCINDTIITTDGTTLLGGDDKCGIAICMTLADLIVNKRPINHGPVEIIFNSDEEVGRGTDFFPYERIHSKVIYTVDGEEEGKVEVETFNAINVNIVFKGHSIHPGSGREGLVNAVSMASSFITMLPKGEMAETTDKRRGYFSPMTIEGGVEEVKVFMLLRDFDLDSVRERLERITLLGKAVEAMYPGGSVEVKGQEIYYNMKMKIDENPLAVKLLTQGVEKAGIKWKFSPIRGGTDGAELSRHGIPSPNMFTGAHNIHSRSEFACLSQMIASVYCLYEVVKLYGDAK